MDPENLSDRAARAALWRLAGSAVGTVSELAVGVLLARLLAPADFGLMGLAVIVLGLARALGDFGIGQAVVQRATLTDRHVRTAFTFSVLLGLAIAFVVMACAPLGGLLMGDSRVTPVLRVLAAAFAFRGSAVVADALLRRELDFRRPFFIDSATYLLAYGGVALPLALGGSGAWSLVWGSLVQAGLASAAQLAATRHSVRPLLARRELLDLLRFGVGAQLNRCANFVALNGDNFVVGRWAGVASLGVYQRAYSLMNVPHVLASNLMTSVLFPAFVRLQNDQERLRRGYLLMTKLTATIAAPVTGAMAIIAPHMVRAVYGSQWDDVVGPLQILCLAGYFRALYHLGGVVAQSVGQVYAELRRQVIYGVLVVVGALLGSPYGLPGVAVGVSLAIMFMFLSTAQLALRVTGTPWHVYCRVQLPALVTGGITCGIVLVVRLTLEALNASSMVITLVAVAASGVPATASLLRTLGDPGFEPLRARLPAGCARLILSARPHSEAWFGAFLYRSASGVGPPE
jgi:PST family polysaccharide transporter